MISVSSLSVGVASVARTLSLLAVLCTLFGGTSARGAEPGSVERWYVIEMSGQRAGYMRTLETRTPETITTESDAAFEIARGAVKLKIRMQGSFVETPDGKPIRMRSVQDMGTMTVEQEYTFSGDTVEVKTTQAGATRTTTMPAPDGAWLTPCAAERYMKQRRESGATEISMRVLTAETGLSPVTSTHRDFTAASLKVGDLIVETTRAKVETSAMPGIVSTEYVDAQGVMVRTETNLGGMAMVMTASTKEEAAAEFEAPEMMINTFVTPDRAIRNPRKVVRATYLVSVTGEGVLPEFATTGTQSVERIDDRSARITVDMTEYAPAPAGEIANAEYMGSSAAIDTDDEEVRKLTERATARAEDDIARAREIRRFVYRFISKKNLGVGFATASEVARSKQGDCSEHGVLTAAMLRVAGIPSRVVAGLVYADFFAGERDIFGYHMWTQALLELDGEERWVDLDATFPASVHYDATHIALAVSSMDETEGVNSMASLAGVLGRLQIKVESTDYEAREPAPAGADR